MFRNKNPQKSIRPAVLITVLVLLITVGTALYFFLKEDGPNNPAQDDGSSFINLDPPTEEEQNVADEQKEKNVENEKKDKEPAKTGKTARVIITDAGQYDSIIEVRAFIPDHYEDGTCTITFTQGSRKVSKETPAYRDASTTICTNPLFKRSEFPTGGQWQVIVSYRATGASGTSESKNININ